MKISFINRNKTGYWNFFLTESLLQSFISKHPLPIIYFSSIIRSSLSEAARPFGLQPGSPSGTSRFFF